MRMIIPLLNLKRTLWCLMLGLSVGIACVAAPALVSVTWAQDADIVDDDAEANPPAAAPRPAETEPASTSNEKRSYLAWAFKSWVGSTVSSFCCCHSVWLRYSS